MVRAFQCRDNRGQFGVRVKFLHLDMNVFLDALQKLKGVLLAFEETRIAFDKTSKEMLSEGIEKIVDANFRLNAQMLDESYDFGMVIGADRGIDGLKLNFVYA